MRILVIGKRGSMTNWVEEALDGFAAAGHEVHFCSTRFSFVNKRIEQLFRPHLISRIQKKIAKARFRFDLILAICPEKMLPALLEAVAVVPHRPPLLGWVGHSMAERQAPTLNLFDGLGYTDTAFIDQHKQFGLTPSAAYVPHAADLTLSAGARRNPNPQLVFVGGGCAYRRSILAPLQHSVALYGPAWKDSSAVAQHECNPRRIYRRELGSVYARYAGTLNLRNEGLVVNGLNQRHFTPAALGLLSVTDAQKDLELCFDPGREALVYETPAELDDICIELKQHPALAEEIAQRGRVRALAHHTYGKRLESFSALAGIA
jgi:spore maturation protein CgeB